MSVLLPHPRAGAAIVRRTHFYGVLVLGGLCSAVNAQTAQSQASLFTVCDTLSAQVATTATINLQLWQDAVPTCQNRPDWLANLGHLLNGQGRYKEAADHLERALMLDPDLLDAQIDYAIALAGTGDLLSARGLLESALTHNNLPERLREPLQRQMLALDTLRPPQQPKAWLTRLHLGVLLGHDSNLLGAPNLTGLPLTLGNTTQILPLEPGYLAQPGRYMRHEATIHTLHRQPDGEQWDVLLNFRQRRSQDLVQASADQYEWVTERSTLGAGADPNTAGSYLRASLAKLHTQVSGGYKVHALAGGWGRSLSVGNAGPVCQARAGLEWQARRFEDNSILSGNYKGLAANWSCMPALNGQAGQQWQAAVRVGQDAPQDATRAGGTQDQSAFQLQWTVPAHQIMTAARGHWQMDAEWVLARDSTAYSPLLENGAVRKMYKQVTRLEYQRQLAWALAGEAWQFKLGYEYLGNHSNLPLFNMRSQGPYISLRVQW